ncbi:MAG: right-handed parallel beta-helix repeat-containing protein [Alphaproteobacteria bacterium]|nr:right-handed parallel beta-helix repeat-containing protein [Alphaproteobacteria bacterium]MDE2110094.1 right-handed parallel beta-helix repeat-containing protein [Alphaproteobacteria bacterium]MDE2495120.1 right-handed parallel beta-helix repeat-containing protein [Alphaproteobacteria bacterium]
MDRRILLKSGAAAIGTTLTRSLALPGPAGPLGADIPWTTYQAEDMRTTGTTLGPFYAPNCVETESSRQRCVKLAAGDYAEFTVQAPANAMVVRYSLPDTADGAGLDSTLEVYRNGILLTHLPVTSKYAWLYGHYPFTNNPADGKPRKFYDEVRRKGLDLKVGDVLRLKKVSDAADYCIIDLVDLENVALPLPQPKGSLSARDFGARGDGESDDTEALVRCVAEAAKQGKVAWIPAGDYKLTGDIDFHDGAVLQGAGMWHTTFVGDEALYIHPERRLRFKLLGEHCRLSDFALIGKLKYRNDEERNDGIFAAHARNGTISRLWIEHTKVGMWFYVSGAMRIEGCRLRNTLADGINLCLGVRNTVIENCTARNTGDDCFAIWPAVSDQGFTQEAPHPGNNVIRRCTGELPFLANGGAIYGGRDNRIEDCLFRDISAGCGILISTTFPTSNADGTVDNNFNGLTRVYNCRTLRSGGYDPSWAWRGAVELCIDRKSICDLRIDQVRIEDSISDGLRVIETNSRREARRLCDTQLTDVTVTAVGLGGNGGHGLTITEGAKGGLTLVHCDIADIKNSAPKFRLLRD